ncbi:MAG: hypothetical protein ABH827_03590 [bacterium]
MLIQKQMQPDAYTSDLLCTFLRFAACLTQQFFAVLSVLSLKSSVISQASAITIKNNLSIHRHHHHHHISH